MALTAPARAAERRASTAPPSRSASGRRRRRDPGRRTGGRGSDGGRATGGDERRELRIETAGRIGVALTVVAAVLHVAGVVTRSFATDPGRVPWGNMYEFTLTGALGVTVIYLVLLRTLGCAGWGCSSPRSRSSC